jgi:DNA-binding response OmpR family regulator
MSTLPTVLVVDDDASTRDLLSDLLPLAGCAAACVADGTSALNRIQHGDIDLVLLDLQLVGADGLEICRRVRAAELGEHLPIIVISGEVKEESGAASRAAGADDIIAKPFDIDDLLDRVRAHLPT